MTMTLANYDSALLPQVIRDNPNHPSADAYILSLKQVQQAIVTQSLGMDKKLVVAVKRHHAGITFTDIGVEVGRSPAWVGKHIKSQDAQTLLALLSHYREAIDGANEAQRRAMAWRIAVRNEQKQPKTSLAALETMNKMDSLARDAKNTMSGGVTVIINQELMPKGALDA